MAELLRIGIPYGWVVLDNKLYDSDPQADFGRSFINNWYEGFTDDVLWIQECLVNEQGEYAIPKTNHFNIDISWLPGNDINGKYYAKLSWMAIDEMFEIEKFDCANRFEIRDRIEYWMMDIKSFDSKYKTRVGK
ncbi:hypothetical protein [Cytophaga aurantiaca]|uniref:hypothetical protein n=1 Tax=Cytophaga aurantiaca TaxID=29530 RepID=UPI00036992F1|nr:hypothetical protein [Cytophaga aurantiaca]